VVLRNIVFVLVWPMQNQKLKVSLSRKTKKGYVEVKLAKADVGSTAGKAKVDTMVSVESLKENGSNRTEKDESATKFYL